MQKKGGMYSCVCVCASVHAFWIILPQREALSLSLCVCAPTGCFTMSGYKDGHTHKHTTQHRVGR